LSVSVVPVDPTDQSAYDAWFAVIEAGNEDRWPGRPGWQPDELRAPALDPDAAVRVVFLAAHLDGRVAGAASVEFPRHDNPHLAQLTVEVTPQQRRRGVGRALVTEVERVAAAEGRSVCFGWEEQRVGTDGSGTIAFATGLGYEMVLPQFRRDLSVPIDAELVAGLGASAAPHAEGYEVVTFESWPEQWLEDRATFGRHMSTDPPIGGMALEEEVWSADRIRHHEQQIDAMGRRLLAAAAVERASGRAVAFSELTVSRSVPEIAYQWDTLVMPEHRGHRLGLLVKLANLDGLAELSPATTTVVTWNAADNGPMIAVNDTLGAEVVSIGRTWQKRL
jgi:GNAT superfamily N-acetyltransferase